MKQKSLFEKGLSVNLLYSKLIAQSETPEWDCGGTGDENTLKTIKSAWENRFYSPSWELATPQDRSQFTKFYNKYCK